MIDRTLAKRSQSRRQVARPLAVVCAVLLGVLAVWAHPNDSTSHSMRSLVRMSEKGPQVMVLLEVPIRLVLKEFEERYINLGKVGADGVSAEQILEFNEVQWDRLSEGLTLKINGSVPEGSWQPVQNPINGKANAGFFVYMIWFQLGQPPAAFDSPFTVEVDNQSFLDVAMFLSGYADCKDAWKITENSAIDLLGEGATFTDASQNPGSWTQDAAMRRMRVVFARDGGSEP